jgi:3',5'-cyclic AMP phosphodiesterase CpdA
MKFQLCPHSPICIRFIGSLLLLAALLLLASCGTWLSGFFWSESEPDERFDDSREMAQPADRNFGNSFSFIFVTDLHIRGGSHAYFRDLKDHLDGAMFVLVGGDITNDGKREDVDEFLAASAALGVPVYAVPGNHDLFDGGWDNTKRIGPSSFTLKLSPTVRLVGLDSANGTLGTEQTEWLSDILSDAKESGIIVMTHMNYFSDGYDVASQFSSVEETAMILSMYRKAGVDVTLSGHTHTYDEDNVDGMKVLVGDAFLDSEEADTWLFVTCTGANFAVERRRY